MLGYSSFTSSSDTSTYFTTTGNTYCPYTYAPNCPIEDFKGKELKEGDMILYALKNKNLRKGIIKYVDSYSITLKNNYRIRNRDLDRVMILKTK